MIQIQIVEALLQNVFTNTFLSNTALMLDSFIDI